MHIYTAGVEIAFKDEVEDYVHRQEHHVGTGPNLQEATTTVKECDLFLLSLNTFGRHDISHMSHSV